MIGIAFSQFVSYAFINIFSIFPSFDKDGKVFKIHKEIHKDEEKKWLNEAKKSNDERAKEQDWLSIHVENFMLNYKNTAWLTESSDQGVKKELETLLKRF